VFIVEAHQLVRRGLSELLHAAGNLTIVGESATAVEALRRIPVEQPDVVLLDVTLPDRSGIDVCRELRSRYPSIRVLMLTTQVDHEVVAGVNAGRGVGVRAETDPQSVPGRGGVQRRCRQIVATPGRQDRSRGPARTAGQACGGIGRAQPAGERGVLDGLVEGLTYRQIGLRLTIAEKTVKDHVGGLVAKLGVEHRTPRPSSGIRTARAHPHRLGLGHHSGGM
jgi:two-component system response regulator DevR